MPPSDIGPLLSEAAADLGAGHLAEARQRCEHALALRPDDPEALHLLGLVRFRQGDPTAGIDLVSRSLDLRPDSAEALANLGAMQEELGHTEAAAACVAAALDLAPDDQALRYQLGRLLYRSGDHAAAEAAYRQVLAAQPDFAAVACDLGFVLRALGRAGEALASFRRAAEAYRAKLPADGGSPEDHFGLGVALQMSGDYAGAEAAYRRVRELAPDHEQAQRNLIAILSGEGRAHDAIAALRGAIALRPDDQGLHRALLTAVLYDPEIGPDQRFAEHERFAKRFEPQPPIGPTPTPASRDPERRLRIAWLSSDFHADHPLPRNLEPILARRDRARFAAICYADVPAPDEVTARFQSLADAWRPIHGRTDREVAELMRADGIDILVVLAGRFNQNRPLVAAYRPAPVQVSFHDPATSGLAAIDYLIADPVLAPRGGQEKFTERVIRLPSFYVQVPPADAPPVGALPADARGAVTLGSLNSPIKINDQVLTLWAAIMREVPHSRLLLHYRNRFEPLRARIAAKLAREGLSPDCLDLAETWPDADHLALYNRIDVALDPFPFTGSTTTFEALWMGVPVVTLLGDAMAGRWGASMLHASHLDELIAGTPSEYVAKAVELARTPARRAELRRTLRARVAASPLCNGPAKARQIERLFRSFWRHWCAAAAG